MIFGVGCYRVASIAPVAQDLRNPSQFGSDSRFKRAAHLLRRVNEAPNSYRDDCESGTLIALPPCSKMRFQ